MCKRDKAELENALIANRARQPSWLELTCGFTEAGREGCIDFVFCGGGSALMLALQPNVELSGRQRRDVLDSERKMGRKALRSMAGAPRCWRSA